MESMYEWNVVAYADDVLIVVEGNSRLVLERAGTGYMNVVTEWARKMNVEVSESKTVCMLLKGTLSGNRPPNVRVNDRMIKYVKDTKYLGVRVEERMRFGGHLRDLRGKVVNLMGCLRRILRKEWGLGKQAMLTVYMGE